MDPQTTELIIPTDEERQQALTIATALGETEPSPIAQIARVIAVLGFPIVEELTLAALAKHAGEGMWLPDQSRQRTPGGIFFTLAYARATKEEWQRMRAKPAAPAFSAFDLKGFFQAANHLEAGNADRLRITVIGRPRRVWQQNQGAYFAISLPIEPPPPLPKGLPRPIKGTRYLAWIGARQWRAVQPALDANPDDKLIVEGYSMISSDFAGIVVVGMKVTTILLQRAWRESQIAKQQQTPDEKFLQK